MRAVTAAYRPLLATSPHVQVVEVQSWLDGIRGPDVPVASGTITYDATAEGQRRLNLTVPLVMDGFRWDPPDNDPEHPLAAFGQRLKVRLGVVHGPTTPDEWFNHGWYLITQTDVDYEEGTVQVTALDLFEIMREATFVNWANMPGMIVPGTSYAVAIRRLMNFYLEVPSAEEPDFTLLPHFISSSLPTLQALQAPLQISRGGDRSSMLAGLATAWGARMRVDDDGILVFSPAITAPKAVADVTYHGDVGGTVMRRGRTQSRSRSYTLVDVQGRNSAGAVIFAIRARYTAVPPAQGLWGSRARYWSSDQVQLASDLSTIANDLYARATLLAVTERVDLVPDYALQLLDTAAVTTDGHTFKGLVTGIQMPLTAAGGPMTIQLARGLE